jgi:RimJ/RimL family protein N-acetyltransferase
MSTFESLETPRLFIRRLRDDDLELLVAYRSLPEVAWMQLWDSYSLGEGRKMIDELKALEPFTANNYFQFAVELKATNELIGDLYFKMDEAGKQAEIGYTFVPKFQGQGLASEAVRKLMDYAFKEKGLHRIYGVTDPRHLRSIAMMKRMGMRQEAHFKESLWFKGAWADDLVFGVLEKEWQ